MALKFDPAAYWRIRGRWYEQRFRAERYRQQEAVLTEYLRGLEFSSVLEVGCGFGRIGEIVAAVRPDATYAGMDISPDQLAAARRRVPAGDFWVGDVRELAETDRYDLVLAVEVLMHLPPGDVRGVVTSLKRIARHHLVTLDWSRPIGRDVKAPDFLHDYRALLGRKAVEVPIGAQSLWHVSR